MEDTSDAAKLRYFELLRAKHPRERLEIAVRLSRALRELALAAVKAHEPQASARQLRRGLAERLYGHEVAERLFPNPG